MLLLDKIYKNYTQKRPIKWTLEHFTLLVEFFPAILVLYSDGLFDKKEAKYLDRLVENIGFFLEDEGFSTQKIKSLKHEFQTEFLYLGTAIETWKTQFLEALQGYLNHYPEQKPNTYQIIAQFAEISGGISEVEQNMIDFLKDYLELVA